MKGAGARHGSGSGAGDLNRAEPRPGRQAAGADRAAPPAARAAPQPGQIRRPDYPDRAACSASASARSASRSAEPARSARREPLARFRLAPVLRAGWPSRCSSPCSARLADQCLLPQCAGHRRRSRRRKPAVRALHLRHGIVHHGPADRPHRAPNPGAAPPMRSGRREKCCKAAVSRTTGCCSRPTRRAAAVAARSISRHPRAGGGDPGFGVLDTRRQRRSLARGAGGGILGSGGLAPEPFAARFGCFALGQRAGEFGADFGSRS